jgi:prepilin-type N-terminal cleavage/methylation domain-containing protein
MNLKSITKQGMRSISGWTLVEMMVCTVIGSLLLAAGLKTLFFVNRSLDASANYAELDRQSRNALDLITSSIRMTGGLTNYTRTQLWFTNQDGTLLKFTWNTNTGYLVCSNFAPGTIRSNLLLKGCKDLQFNVFKRVPLSNSTMLFEPLLANDSPTLTKVIVMDWICRRTNYATLSDSESVQTAKVVLRN